MRAWLPKSWPLFKVLFAIAILIAVGDRFARDLHVRDKGWHAALADLWHGLRHPGWLIVSGALYILGLGFSALYWYRLLRELDQRPGRLEAVRAYYVGHAGKYLPGKAWAVFLRAGLVRGPDVTFARAVLTTFYEVLVTMAGGTLLAIVLVAFLAPNTVSGMDWAALRNLLSGYEPAGVIDRKVLLMLGVILLLPIGIPILPPVYNRIIARMATRIRKRYGITGPLPRIRTMMMLEGLILPACGWVFLGGSLFAVLQGVMPNPPVLTAPLLGRLTAYLALAYVAGFIIILVPSGLGIREFFLTLFLMPEIASFAGGDGSEATIAVAAVLYLRLVWTCAEIVVIPALYLLPDSLVKGRATESEPAGTLETAGSAASEGDQDPGQGSSA
jgi:hypothetical protein